MQTSDIANDMVQFVNTVIKRLIVAFERRTRLTRGGIHVCTLVQTPPNPKTRISGRYGAPTLSPTVQNMREIRPGFFAKKTSEKNEFGL
jgi:hypothetical protein